MAEQVRNYFQTNRKEHDKTVCYPYSIFVPFDDCPNNVEQYVAGKMCEERDSPNRIAQHILDTSNVVNLFSKNLFYHSFLEQTFQPVLPCVSRCEFDSDSSRRFNFPTKKLLFTRRLGYVQLVRKLKIIYKSVHSLRHRLDLANSVESAKR